MSKTVAARQRRKEKVRKTYLISALEEWEQEGRDIWKIPKLRKPLHGCARIYGAHGIDETIYRHVHCEPFPDPEIYPHLAKQVREEMYNRPEFSTIDRVTPRVERVRDLLESDPKARKQFEEFVMPKLTPEEQADLARIQREDRIRILMEAGGMSREQAEKRVDELIEQERPRELHELDPNTFKVDLR